MNYPIKRVSSPDSGPGAFGHLAPLRGAYNGLRYKAWHERVIDLLIARPDLNIKEIAAEINKEPQTVHLVMRSDSFKARYAYRRQEHNDRISQTIVSDTQDVARMALAGLRKKLSDDQVVSRISPRDLHEIANSALDRIGLGPKGADIVVQTNVNNHTTSVTVDAASLQRAQLRLRQNEAVLINGYDTDPTAQRGREAPERSLGGAVSTPASVSIIESIVTESETIRPRSAVDLDAMLAEFEDCCISVPGPSPAGGGPVGEGVDE